MEGYKYAVTITTAVAVAMFDAYQHTVHRQQSCNQLEICEALFKHADSLKHSPNHRLDLLMFFRKHRQTSLH